jgi:hypothetical protein
MRCGLVEIASCGTLDLDALLTGMQERFSLRCPATWSSRSTRRTGRDARDVALRRGADLVAAAGELAFGAGQPFNGLVSRVRVDDTSTGDTLCGPVRRFHELPLW